MRCLVVAGGSAEDLPSHMQALGQFDQVVAADGGVANARRLGLTPTAVIGDLDSLSKAQRERLQRAGVVFDVHRPDKDETDLELALLWCAARGANEIIILAAFGDRPDHTLGNILLLAHPRLQHLSVRLVSRRWQGFLSRGEATLHGKPGDTVSLIPLSPRVTGIWSQGLQYALHGETLVRGPGRGISNVMLGSTAHLRFATGLLFVFHGPPQG